MREDMAKKNQFFDDVAKVAGGALSAVGGVKEEMEALVRQRVEKFINDQNLVNREEFDVIKEMLSEIQKEQANLNKKITDIENIKRSKPKKTIPKASK